MSLIFKVGLRRPYNMKADVYSWSMVMWYIMALEPPMGLYTPRMFIDKVFKKGTRPATNVKWPQGLCRLMKECWDNNIFQRPTFVEIMKALRDEMTLIDAQVAVNMGAGTDSVAGSLTPEKRIEEAYEFSIPDARHLGP